MALYRVPATYLSTEGRLREDGGVVIFIDETHLNLGGGGGGGGGRERDVSCLGLRSCICS